MAQFKQTAFGSHFAAFEDFGFWSGVREHGVSEANAGVGLGVGLLLLAAVLGSFFFRRRVPRNETASCGIYFRLLRLSPWLALLGFMAKVGTYENARQLAPYYPLLFPGFLVMAGQGVVVRQRLWQWLGLATMMLTVFLLITLAERPLFPVASVLEKLRERFPDSRLVFHERLQYLASNCDGLEMRRNCLRQALPPDATVVGYFAGMCDGDEPGLWLPYGQRRVEWILPEDSAETVRAAGIRHAIVNGYELRLRGASIQDWLKKYNAEIIGQFALAGVPVAGPPPPDFSGLFLVRLN